MSEAERRGQKVRIKRQEHKPEIKRQNKRKEKAGIKGKIGTPESGEKGLLKNGQWDIMIIDRINCEVKR